MHCVVYFEWEDLNTRSSVGKWIVYKRAVELICIAPVSTLKVVSRHMGSLRIDLDLYQGSEHHQIAISM